MSAFSSYLFEKRERLVYLKQQYQQGVGCARFLSNIVIYSNAYTTIRIAQKQSEQTESHMQALKHFAKYLAG